MQHVMVIGGGVVGLTTAWSLLEAGFEVSVVEREAELAQGASRANGGQLSYRFVSPLADSGVPPKALRWLFEPDSPLRFKPEWSLHQWKWLAAFLGNCQGLVEPSGSLRVANGRDRERQSHRQRDPAVCAGRLSHASRYTSSACSRPILLNNSVRCDDLCSQQIAEFVFDGRRGPQISFDQGAANGSFRAPCEIRAKSATLIYGR